MHPSLAILAELLDRLGHHEAAATISRVRCTTACARGYFPEIDTTITHLREVLGDDAYETFARSRRNHDQRRHGELCARADRPGPRAARCTGDSR